ncbi:MAG: LacI family DNA-binding transcriptional regulator [Microbacteriaceae bacterium]
MREVAQHAGVGTKTVSRVINGEPNVSAAMTSRVLRAIEALQWSPDATASNLKRTVTRTRTIGLLLGSVENPFSAVIHRAIEDAAAARDVAVFASSLDEDPAREAAAVQAFVRRKVDALILTCAAGSQEYISELVPARVPIVFIDRRPTGYSADIVRSDNRDGARQATRHMLSLGHRRVAGLFDRIDIWTAAERRYGFFDALAEFGIPADPAMIVTDIGSPEHAEAAIYRLFGSPTVPTAIFSSQNLITEGTVRALQRLSRQREVAVVGFDEIELGDLLSPGVTVLAQRPAEIGRIAAERLFARLDGDRTEPRDTVVGVDLLARGSGEIRPPV